MIVIQGWKLKKSCETLLRFHKPNRECEALTGTSNTFHGWYKQQRIICSVLLYPYGKIPLGPITHAAFVFVFSIYWNATVSHLCLKQAFLWMKYNSNVKCNKTALLVFTLKWCRSVCGRQRVSVQRDVCSQSNLRENKVLLHSTQVLIRERQREVLSIYT